MKKPKLVNNWRRILWRSSSVWFGGYLPVLWLASVEVAYAAFGVEISPAAVWVVAIALPLVVPALRVWDQGLSR